MLRSAPTDTVLADPMGRRSVSIRRSLLAPWSLDRIRVSGDAIMVMYAALVMALSLADDPLTVVAVVLLLCSGLGATVLIIDLLSDKHRDRLSMIAFRRLAWMVAALAAAALLLLALGL